MSSGGIVTGSGNDQIVNETGGTVTDGLHGGDGDNTIINRGLVKGLIEGGADADTITNSGELSGGVRAGGGKDVIDNSGTISGYLYGQGGDDAINNRGSIEGDLHAGSGNDTVTNSGVVGGYLTGGDGDDTITLLAGSSVTGRVFGGDGDDRLVLASGESHDADRFRDFEHLSLAGSAQTTLTGVWDFSGGDVTVESGGNAALAAGASLTTPAVYMASGAQLTNHGAIYGDIDGTAVAAGGPGNTIINQGEVTGSIKTGAADDDITNSGTVGNGINAGEGNDRIENLAGGEVSGGLHGGDGNDTIINQGSVQGLLEGGAGENTIINQGGLQGAMRGGSGDDYLVNTGEVSGYMYGGTGSGNDTIINSGTVGGTIFGSELGHATIINSGFVGEGIAGYGGDNQITNTGTVAQSIQAVEGNDQIYNSGSVGLHIKAGSGDDTLVNSGRVGGYLHGGEGNDTLINLGSVGEYISGGDGDDTVILLTGSSVTGRVFGGDGDDRLVLATGQTQDADRFRTFEYLTLAGDGGPTTLTGDWDFSSGDVTVESGSVTLAQDASLVTLGLDILDHGALYILGEVLVSGDTDNWGYLGVDGRLETTNLLNQGILGGTGTIVGDVINTGTIAPGNSMGTLTIQGDLTNDHGGLAVELGPHGGDLLRVTGTAFLQGGLLRVSLLPAVYLDGHRWDVLIAETVQGSFDGLYGGPDSAVLSLHMLTRGDRVSLVLHRRPYTDFAVTPGGRGVGAWLDSLLARAQAQGGDAAALITLMDFSYSAAEIGQALEALSPAKYAAYPWAGLESAGLAADAVLARLEQVRRSEREEPTAEPGPSVWGRVLGARSDYDGGSGGAGHARLWGGIISGVDGAVNSHLRLGAALGMTLADMSWDEPRYLGDMKSLHALAYGAAHWDGPFLRGQWGLAHHQADSSTSLDLPGLPGNTQSDISSFSALADLNGGYEFSLDRWRLGPFAGLRYIRLDQGGYRVRGLDGQGLDIAALAVDSLAGSLGFQARGSWIWRDTEFRPRLGLSWRHEFLDDTYALRAGFTGLEDLPYPVDASGLPADLAVIDAGLTASLSRRLDASLEISQTLGGGYSLSTLSLSFQYNF